MRKYIATCLVATMAVSLFGCAGKTEGKTTLAEYKGLTAYEEELKTDDLLKEKIEAYCDFYKEDKTREKGKVDSENTANVTYTGTIKLDDGTEYTLPEGSGSATEATVDVDSEYLTGETALFAKDIIGKKVGKTFEVKTQFPEDYENTAVDAEGNTIELKGKDVTYSITINSRTETIVPEYNDKFVKKHFGAIADNTKDFEAYVTRRIKTENFIAAVWEKFYEECKIDSYDSDEYESIYDQRDQYNEDFLSELNANLDIYLEAVGKTKDDYKEKLKSDTESYLKEHMVIEKIAKDEGIEIKADSENFKTLEKQYVQYNVLKDYPNYQKVTKVAELEQLYNIDAIVFMINTDLVYDFITDSAVVEKGERPTEAPTTTEEAEEASTTEAASEEAESK